MEGKNDSVRKFSRFNLIIIVEEALISLSAHLPLAPLCLEEE